MDGDNPHRLAGPAGQRLLYGNFHGGIFFLLLYHPAGGFDSLGQPENGGVSAAGALRGHRIFYFLRFVSPLSGGRAPLSHSPSSPPSGRRPPLLPSGEVRY